MRTGRKVKVEEYPRRIKEGDAIPAPDIFRKKVPTKVPIEVPVPLRRQDDVPA